MARNKIPERQPIGDTVSGVIVRADDKHLLALDAVPETETAHAGAVVLRYGVRYLGKPFLSIVPGIVALEYGDMLTGDDAWEFLYKKSNLHPRADVVGYRNDGTDEMILVRQLDMALPPEVIAYADDTATKPLALLDGFIGSAAEAESLPARLREYLPRYDDLADWRANRVEY